MNLQSAGPSALCVAWFSQGQSRVVRGGPKRDSSSRGLFLPAASPAKALTQHLLRSSAARCPRAETRGPGRGRRLPACTAPGHVAGGALPQSSWAAPTRWTAALEALPGVRWALRVGREAAGDERSARQPGARQGSWENPALLVQWDLGRKGCCGPSGPT